MSENILIKNFISVDLETTSLSPEDGRIIEVGAVKQELVYETNKGVSVREVDSFESLINPEIEVPITVFELTGIKQEELDGAPKWSEIKIGLEEFIGDGVVLGHNVDFDLTFLEAQGIRLNKKNTIDTLKMAMMFLPLAKAHSLEYLAESFGVGSEGAHRALFDARVAGVVAGEILNEVLMLPENLQTEIRELLSDPEGVDLLSKLPVEALKNRSVQQLEKNKPASSGFDFDFQDKIIYTSQISGFDTQKLARNLVGTDKSILAAVPDRITLSELPYERVIPCPAHSLCTIRYQYIIDQKDRLDENWKRFLVKLMIFRHYNDSLSLAKLRVGPEERGLLRSVTADSSICLAHKCEYTKQLTQKIKAAVAVDHFTLFQVARDWSPEVLPKQLVVFDLNELEENFASGLDKKWNSLILRNILSSVFPLEKEKFSWAESLPKKIDSLAAELDLFFGILHLIYLKREGEYAQNLIVDEVERESERFAKLVKPAEKMIRTVEEGTEELRDRAENQDDFVRDEMIGLADHLENYLGFVKEFFQKPNDDHVYWLRFNSEWVDLYRSEIDLKSLWENLEDKFETVSIIESDLPNISYGYYQKHLGIDDYKKITENFGFEGGEDYDVYFSERELSLDQVAQQVKACDGSVVLVVPNENQLKKYFTDFREQEIGKNLLAYKYTGGLSRLRLQLDREEGEFLLLLSTHAYLRYFQNLPFAENLIIMRLPFEAPPMLPVRLQAQGDADFMSTTLPRAIATLHKMIFAFVKGAVGKKKSELPKRRKVFLDDPRAKEKYGGEIKKYFEDLKNFTFPE